MAKALSLSSVGLASLLGLACGSDGTLVNENYAGEPLELVNGTLTSTGDLETPEQISLAVMWLSDPPDPAMSPPAAALADPPPPSEPMCTGSEEVGTQEMSRHLFGEQKVVQPVSFEAEFPIRFQVPITTLPPESVMQDLTESGGSGRMAEGILFAYVDGNRNGTYDPGVPGDVPDRILTTSMGPSVMTWIIFLDGKVAGSYPPAWMNAPQGFSLNRKTTGVFEDEILPISTPIELSLSAETERIARIYTCKEAEFHRQIGDRPADVAVDCSDDGRSYRWVATVPNPYSEEFAMTCVRRLHSGGACLEPSAPVPAGWPCQVE